MHKWLVIAVNEVLNKALERQRAEKKRWGAELLKAVVAECFPRNGCQLHDMIGHVWEWTHSLYFGSPYRADAGREAKNGVGLRVLPVFVWRSCRLALSAA